MESQEIHLKRGSIILYPDSWKIHYHNDRIGGEMRQLRLTKSHLWMES